MKRFFLILVLSIALQFCFAKALPHFFSNGMFNQSEAKIEQIKSQSDQSCSDLSNERNTTIYYSVEKMPRYPGGEAALKKYVDNNLKFHSYQTGCLRFQGNVITQFVVEADGSIGEVKVVKGIHKNLDEEAVRIVKSLPNFEPGLHNGQPVAVWYTLPISFLGDDIVTVL